MLSAFNSSVVLFVFGVRISNSSKMEYYLRIGKITEWHKALKILYFEVILAGSFFWEYACSFKASLGIPFSPLFAMATYYVVEGRPSIL